MHKFVTKMYVFRNFRTNLNLEELPLPDFNGLIIRRRKFDVTLESLFFSEVRDIMDLRSVNFSTNALANQLL